MRKLDLLKIGAAALATLATITVIGCGKSNNNNSQQNGGAVVTPGGTVTPSNVVSVPTPNSCFNRLTTDTWGARYRPWRRGNRRFMVYGYGDGQYSWSGFYNSAPMNGAWPRNYVNNLHNHGFCGCPMGTQPVCDTNAGGMMCLPVAPLANAGYRLATWNLAGAQLQFNAYVGYNSGYYASNWIYDDYNRNNVCFSSIGQACQVGFNNSCGSGVCAPVAQGSNLGVCVASGW